MEVTVHLPDALHQEERAKAARSLIRAVARVNLQLMRKGLVPPLYESGVVYGEEVGFEEFADALTTYTRGVGDCDDLAAWRLAELWEEHSRAVAIGARPAKAPWPDVRMTGQEESNGETLVHVLVRHWDGTEEDPSAVLGMP